MYVCISLLYEDVKFVLISERKIVGVLPKKEPTPKSIGEEQAACCSRGIATANDETKIAHSLFSKLLLILVLKPLAERDREIDIVDYLCRRPCLCNFGSVMQ